MKDFKFTLFTPCYNGGVYIHRVFESIKQQTYKNFEWFIVNDCSTDNSNEIIVEELKNISSDIDVHYFVNQKNLGKHRSWNKIAQLASGDLWICCDCDDSFEPDTLAIFNERWNLIADNDQIGGMNCLCKDSESGKIVGQLFPSDNFIMDKFEMAHKYKIGGEKWDCMRCDLIKQIQFPEIETSYYMESYIWFRLSYLGYKLLCINIPLRNYTSVSNSLTHDHSISINKAEMISSVYKWVIDHYFWYLCRYDLLGLLKILRYYLFTKFIVFRHFVNKSFNAE